ncbi:leucine-rich repeat domain-containing protein [uncultured Prevotella sp.]|uniref:leucine-rich repeat domain-containing protein n=2 Tax=Prevotella TaxID=838 RepID=UPI0025F6259C|nr:leucine-rich repeat domain-containing protein [uncultured Prevotella sp.]
MHNIKQLYSKHFGRAVVYTLLSLFLCMAGAGKAAAVEFTYKPQVKVISTNYTNSGTEVTLKLWMYNLAGGSSRFIKNRTVDLYIDDQLQQSLLLNNLWQKISNAEAYEMRNYVTSGPVGNKSSISFNFKDIGTAQFSNLQIYQYNENDGKGTQTARWCTIELKLSFDNTFSYYGHKISVRGLWQDNSGRYPITEYVSLDNTIGGYVRPTKLNVRSFDSSKMRLSWKIQDYNGLASKKGSWIIYKCENGKRERIGSMEYYDNFFNFDIQKKKYNCSATYDVTFKPRQFTPSDTICGLTTSVAATGHKPNADDVCQICNHSFFRYTTSDGKIVNIIINRNQFGANIVAHSVVNGKCVIEFDGPITKIPENAFDSNKSLTGDLVIPNSVTEIGEMAFYYCTGLNGTLTLSNKLETIGSNAFKNCSGFTGSLILPNSLTTIGKMAFFGCKGFKDLTLSKALSVIPEEAFKNCSSLTGDLVIPNSVKEIGNSAFDYCTGFNGTLTLSNKLETIGRAAFLKCSGFKGSLILPNSLTTIGELAFQECEGFTELTLPNALSVIPIQTFYGCKSLSGNLVIPASVKEIGKLAFYSCTALNGDSENPSQITLPESLEKIHDSVFLSCNRIKTIKYQSLPEGISKSIGAQKTVSLSDDSYISDKASGTVNEISYTRKMSSDWGTLVLPYPLTLTGNEPYHLYSIDNMTGEELVLKQLEGVVAAGTPCVVKRNGSEAELTFGNNKAKLNMAINDQLMDGMNFSGTYWTKDVTNGYIIAKDCFWSVAELNKSDLVKGVKVKPFRAWLDGTSPNGASQLSICVSDTATGIGAAGTIDVLNDTATEYYDLSGKRLDEPQKGVNIVRMKSGKTKKIIIK